MAISTAEVERSRSGDRFSELADLIAAAQEKETSPFDYIIVGSGAGGGPIAARLALAGKRVLVLEAGHDPKEARPSPTFPGSEIGEVTQIPGYHGAATEDAELSWQFSVRHYLDNARQAKDAKYNQIPLDPNRAPQTNAPLDPKYLDTNPPPQTTGKRGILYPRSCGIGGCTGHHAMIMVTPNDRDWNQIANLTGDDSWRPERMHGYFAKLERCLYRSAYDRFFRKHPILGPIYAVWRSFALLLDPRGVLDNGGHGLEGWQPTSLIDPNLVESIAEKDSDFISVLARSALAVLHGNPLKALVKNILFRFRLLQALDPNDLNTRRSNPEGVFLIPLGIQSEKKAVSNKSQQRVLTGNRVGVREFLLNTQAKCPENLVIATGYHVTRIIFEKAETRQSKNSKSGSAPRAIGVEAAKGDHLYQASPLQTMVGTGRANFFAKKATGEVILAGGAFNTPQLLMLSGIGERGHLVQHDIDGLYNEHGKRIHDIIDLPGVGKNLQDRYEVTVVSELAKDFETLSTLTFTPGDKNDRARQEWFRAGTGLYATNGGTIAVIRRSVSAGAEDPPDLFTFGAPAAFRGYYWGWSRELLARTLGATTQRRNLWSWVILKAYTRNNAGTVRLRSDDPFDVPDVYFDSFNEAAEKLAPILKAEAATWRNHGLPLPPQLEKEIEENNRNLLCGQRDLAALEDAVRFMRRVNAQNSQFRFEIQPGAALSNDSPALRDWIKTQAWGHHASCTCRIGSDRWQENISEMADKNAVLDSKFRVHGITGLRVVDASAFPYIPGYFILTPILMISEKAADTLLQEPIDSVYPASFRAKEASAIRERRKKARVEEDPDARETPETELPSDTVGLAISGGGIRSATFALGVLQSLAERDRLRQIDIMSSVSGGGFMGSFLGRLFTRDIVTESKDPAGRVQDILKNTGSGPLWWLRTQANYIFAGANDIRLNLAVFWRNIFSVHLVMGVLTFSLFGFLAWLARTGVELWPQLKPPTLRSIELSAWWSVPILVLALGVLPLTLGYWLAPKVGSYRWYPFFALLAWFVLVTGTLVAAQLPCFVWGTAIAIIALLLLSWLWQEVARWGAVKQSQPNSAESQGASIVRNRLGRSLGHIVIVFLFLVAWVVLDTFAGLFSRRNLAGALTAAMIALGPVWPLLRSVGLRALQQISAGSKEGVSLVRVANLLGIPLAVFLLLTLDVLAHKFVTSHSEPCIFAILLTGIFFAIALGRAFDFLNQSSLRATYASRLARTFLGASNEERVYSSTDNDFHDVELAHPKDDLPYDRYHPEANGGPLHLINACINETIDVASAREIRERKGLPMCVGPHGVSVGRRYFAEWTQPDELPRWQKHRRWRDGLDAEDDKPMDVRRLTALKAIPVSNDPGTFHVLKNRKSESAEVESLSLSAWTSISGAAFSTGVGRGTKLQLSLFNGLANVRLGYWWDTGILSSERPGRYPPGLWGKIVDLPGQLFRTQSMLLAEWLGRFRGPSEWFWYLSDGGHFEVTGLYELLRRRVRLIIAIDSADDPDYQWHELGLLMQQVREDFGAEIIWLDPSEEGSENVGWEDLERALIAGIESSRAQGAEIIDAETMPPDSVQRWINPYAIGSLAQIRRSDTPRHAALARVTYDSSSDVSWILLIKPSLSPNLTRDILSYATSNTKFPQDPTLDQVFDDQKWESYRALGQQIGRLVLPASVRYEMQSA